MCGIENFQPSAFNFSSFVTSILTVKSDSTRFIARTMLAAAIAEGRYLRKVAFYRVCLHIFLARSPTNFALSSVDSLSTLKMRWYLSRNKMGDTH